MEASVCCFQLTVATIYLLCLIISASCPLFLINYQPIGHFSLLSITIRLFQPFISYLFELLPIGSLLFLMNCLNTLFIWLRLSIYFTLSSMTQHRDCVCRLKWKTWVWLQQILFAQLGTEVWIFCCKNLYFYNENVWPQHLYSLLSCRVRQFSRNRNRNI